MRHPGWDEYRPTGAGDFRSIAVAERQFAFQDVPGLIIGMVDVEGWRSAPSPFMNTERITGRGKRRCLHPQILARFQRLNE